MSDSSKNLNTIKQSSKLITGATEYRIRQWCINGELPCIKAGRKYLINEQVLLDFVAGKLQTEQQPEYGTIRRVI